VARSEEIPRSAFGSLCSLLVVSLLVGASLSAVEPGIRDLGRDTANQRLAVRHLTVSVARAVRQLVGEKHQAGQEPARNAGAIRPVLCSTVSASEHAGPRVAPIRVELLNLPPPARIG
jgi:hypothetical protein